MASLRFVCVSGDVPTHSTLRKAQGPSLAFAEMAGLGCRIASRKRPTITASENNCLRLCSGSRSATGSPGARCSPCLTA
jgi:hypothetical protein